MAAGIIGKALIVAWSFTLTNLGPTPQIINLGPAPTNSNYVPVECVIRNVQTKVAVGLILSFGTNQKNPINVLDSEGDPSVTKWMAGKFNGYLTYGMSGNSIVPADQNLYVEYSLPKTYPATDKSITIDVLAYPTN